MSERVDVSGVRSIAAANRGTVILAAILGVIVLDVAWRIATNQLAVSSFSVLLWDGILRGLIIGLAGVGLAVTYSVLNFANFAHGDYMTSGAFAGWSVTYVIAGFGTEGIPDLLFLGPEGNIFGSELGITLVSTPLAILAGLAVAGLAAIVVGLLFDRFVYKSMRNASGIALLIASVGVAFALRYLIVFFYSPSSRGVVNSFEIQTLLIAYVVDGYLGITTHDVAVIVFAVTAMLLVHYQLNYTKIGKAMRAMADNKDLARISGIPIERAIRLTWIIGGGLAGISGYLLALWGGNLVFDSGWLLLIFVFSAVILGGIGSVYGAIFGGLVIGVAMNVSVLWLPTSLARVTPFFIMIIILLYKPRGVFGGVTSI